MLFDSSDRNNGIIVVLCVGCYDVKMEARKLILNAPHNRVVFVLISTYIIIGQHNLLNYTTRELLINRNSQNRSFSLSHKFLQDFIYS